MQIKGVRIPWAVAVATALAILIGCLWPWTMRYCNQLIYRAADGTTYALGTHPGGLGFVTTTHGRELDELWRVHQDPLPGGLAFDGFKWGDTRSATYYGMNLQGTGQDASQAVFSRTDVRHWEAPEHDFGGLGWGGERRTVGPPIPPEPLSYVRRVFAVPFWAMEMVLVYGVLAWAKRRYIASRPARAPLRSPRRADDDLPLLRK